MATQKCTLKVKAFLPVIFFLSICSLTMGILMSSITQDQVEVPDYLEFNYTYCLNYFGDMCYDHLQYQMDTDSKLSCVCYMSFNLTKALDGAVTLFYELETFDQQKLSFASSRDPEQLKGKHYLPSESCEPYRYVITNDSKKLPIFPCGEVADYMFNDTFSLGMIDSNKNKYLVPILSSGMIGEYDKKEYQNPKEMDMVKQYFAKPVNWHNSVWDLDTTDPENNGVQNEAFIAWMRTDWKLKPIWRVNHTDPVFARGLPEGQYTMRINYNYPPSRYNGTRKFRLSAIPSVEKTLNWNNIIGIAAIALSCLLMIVGAILIYLSIAADKRNPEEREVAGMDVTTSNRNSVILPEGRPLNPHNGL